MSCPFCKIDPARIVAENSSAIAIWDGFPVSAGHALVISKRHVSDWFAATFEEQTGILKLISKIKWKIDEKFSPDGYNIGINIGESAGQTVDHLHVHLIPRYKGDVEDPTGGVR